jgi:oligopeptide/dipeptide ABC transporter ATP-binding protein
MADPLLEVRDLRREFDVSGGLLSRLVAGPRVIKAVDGVTFGIPRRTTLALVGESGSGKSTTARLIARLIPATSGEVRLGGRDVLGASGREMRALRKQMQIVFQDPFGSLNPRMRVEEIVGRPLAIHFGLRGAARRERVAELLRRVGLSADQMGRFPHQFSGGQRQRIAIARALAPEPSLLLADEAVSSLDVSVQAQVLELMATLRERLELTMLFITHDLRVAEFVADDVAVMYGGRIMERGPARLVFADPLHPYTKVLLAARPRAGERAPAPVSGEPMIPLNPPPGCRFAHRCPIAIPECRESDIPLRRMTDGREVACIRV